VRELNCDACVIGGGPAGAAMARRLATLGHAVILLEKARFPRRHIGESVTPAVLPLFEILGIREIVEHAGFLRPGGALVRWTSGDTQYREARGDAGFQVERERFDSLLLDAARSAGANVLQPCRLLAWEQSPDSSWKLRVRTDSGGVAVRARILADATGRTSITGGRKQATSPATLALSGYWRGVPSPGVETRIEAGTSEWYWGAPLANGEFNATVFIDPERYRAGTLKSGSQEAFYAELLGNSVLLRDCLNGRLVSGPRACDSTCYADDEPVTNGSIRTGEAAFTIDPLSSQGILTAMGSALHAATVVHTIFRRPQDTAMALEFYRNRVQSSVRLHHRAAGDFYAQAAARFAADFWQDRALPKTDARGAEAMNAPLPGWGDLVALSPAVRIGSVPVVSGSLITTGQGVFAPGLEEPAVFLNGVPFAPLMSVLDEPRTMRELILRWEFFLPRGAAVDVFRWAFGKGIVVRSSSGSLETISTDRVLPCISPSSK
jgi:flavin-dependent dehydrogenase